MQIPKAPKGTRDFYPEDMAFREFIFSSWQTTCQRYGFELFDAPMFEHLDLYTQKSGQEIEKQLYAFADKGGRQIALRPELTPSLARMVASKGTSLKRPVRWYSIPRLFRYERMQRGRLREFFQLNMDILGTADVTADAELMAASVAMMQELGLDHNDFSVLVSSRKLLEEFLEFCGVPSERNAGIYALLDRRHKLPAAEFDQELSSMLGDAVTARKVREVLEVKSLDDLAAIDDSLPSYHELRGLFALIDMYGLSDYVQFDIGIVRGLAYYTGIVFELFDRRRSLRAIAGGGRYDRLIQTYGGPSTPAVGFAAGDVVLGELLKDNGIVPPIPPRSTVFVAAFEDGYPGQAIAVAQQLRAGGISAEYPLRNVSISRQLKLANDARARLVIFVGGDEARQGRARIKNMATGAEKTASLDALVAAVTAEVPDNEMHMPRGGGA